MLSVTHDGISEISGPIKGCSRLKKKIIIYGGITLVALIYIFFAAPNLNPLYSDGAFFWLALVTIYLVTSQIIGSKLFSLEHGDGKQASVSFNKDNVHFRKWLLIVLGALWVIYFGVMIGSSVFFHYKAYRDQMPEPTVKVFDNEVQALDTEQIPVVDRDLAYKLADKQLGEKTSLGSQVYVGEPTIQQVNGKLVWAVPLHHSGVFKWLANLEGSDGYIIVSATNQNDVQYVDQYKIKIQPDCYLLDDLERHVRLGQGLFTGITDYSFELDDSGKPYWVVTTYKNLRGFALPEANGVIIVDATTGSMERYGMDNIPEWVDRVQPRSFIREQMDNKGKYIHGIFNFSNKDKYKMSDGDMIVYNNNRCYMLSGMTSIGSDESLISFVMVDMKTKEPLLYKISGSTEQAAQNSAQGKVQDLGYSASFPLILNIDSQPTYFMTLKDAEGLIKQYAFVSVNSYGVVGTGQTIADAKKDYDKSLIAGGVQTAPKVEKQKIEGTVERIASEMTDNTTVYRILLEGSGTIYQLSSNLSPELALTQKGDKVVIEYAKTDETVITASSFDNQSIGTTQ